jgi:hypothetical protein
MKLLLTILSLAAFLFAQEAAPAPEKKADKPAKAKTVEIKGTLVSVDTAAGSIVVKTEKGQDTVMCDKATKIKSPCKKKCTLATIKPDCEVTVKYQEKDGKMCATSITEKKASVKKEKAPEAAPAPAPAAPAKK